MKDDQGNAPVLQMMQELMRKSGGGSKKGSPKGIKPRRTVIVEQPAKMKAVQPNLHVREQVDYRDRHLTTHSRTPDPLPKEEQEDDDDFTG